MKKRIILLSLMVIVFIGFTARSKNISDTKENKSYLSPRSRAIVSRGFISKYMPDFRIISKLIK